VNERIQEIALEAGLLNYIDNETPRQYFINGHADLEEVEKFAEMLIQRCVYQCEFVANMATISESGQLTRSKKVITSAGKCAQMIKQHFGVEL